MARSGCEWREVPGTNGEVIACSDGRIARVTGTVMSNGYVETYLSKPIEHGKVKLGAKKTYGTGFRAYVHRLIAITFLGEPPDGQINVNHKDFNKQNNAAENLEWCSHQENMQHAWKAGKCPQKLRKYTPEQYRKARELYASGNYTYAQVAELTGMNKGGCQYAIADSERTV